MFQTGPVFQANLTSTADIVVNQGGTDCFVGSQSIVTNNGVKPIVEIKKGDLVLSHDFNSNKDVFKPVLKVFKFVNEKKTVRVNLKNGKTITCTEDHLFFFRGEWNAIGKILSLLNESRNMESDTGI